MKNMISKLIGFFLNTLVFVAPWQAGRIGFNIFCHPFRLKLTARQLEFLKSADQFQLDHGGEVIQGYRWGNGSKNILLLHGWQSHTYRWKAYVDAINKDEYAVYAIDAPGHGLSSGGFMTVPLYSEVIRKTILHIGKVHHLVAHSIGSFTAIYTFYKHPELTPDRVMMLASPGEANDFFQFYKKTLSLSSKTLHYIVQHFEKVIGLSPDYFSISRFAQQLSTAALIIHDEDDDETPVENSRIIHRSISGSRLIITKGKGHNLKSKEVVHEVISFMEDTPKEISTPNFTLQAN